jgi:hypothetical protein
MPNCRDINDNHMWGKGAQPHYARAAAWIAGIDRWSERKWRELERQLGIETKLADSPSRMPRTPAENRQKVGPDDVRQAIVARRRRAGWLGPRPRGWLRPTV